MSVDLFKRGWVAVHSTALHRSTFLSIELHCTFFLCSALVWKVYIIYVVSIHSNVIHSTALHFTVRKKLQGHNFLSCQINLSKRYAGVPFFHYEALFKKKYILHPIFICKLKIQQVKNKQHIYMFLLFSIYHHFRCKCHMFAKITQ